MPNERSAAEAAAETYYDSGDTTRFYEHVCGGDDIHVGLYGLQAGALDIAAASHRATVAMADRVQRLAAGAQVLDLGSGYGGAARYLARRFACKVRCVNISEVQNERNRRLNRGAGLHEHIEVLHGSFQDLPVPAASADLVWAQGSFLHSAERGRLVAEIARVLRPCGQLLFSDQMQADDCPPGVLQPFYERFKVRALASPRWYRRELARAGLRQEEWCDLTPELLNHYSAMRTTLRQRYERLSRLVSTAYMDRMLVNLNNWVSAAHAGYLRWGIFHFSKPGAD